MMLAADARAEGAAIEGHGGARAAMGREEIVRSLEPYLAQIKGHIQEASESLSLCGACACGRTNARCTAQPPFPSLPPQCTCTYTHRPTHSFMTTLAGLSPHNQ